MSGSLFISHLSDAEIVPLLLYPLDVSVAMISLTSTYIFLGEVKPLTVFSVSHFVGKEN